MTTTARSRAARWVVVVALSGSLTLVAGASPAQAQTIGLDPTFAGGKVVIDVGPVDRGGAVAIQADGKVVVAGGARRADHSTDMVVLRRMPDGRPDPAFGTGGQVVIKGIGQPAVDGMAIQPDGRILVANHRTIRLMPDGQVDPSWNTVWTMGYAKAIAVLPDSRVLVAGQEGNSTYVTRLHANGSTDETFGDAGTVVTRFSGSASDDIRELIVTPDGGILIAGSTGYGGFDGGHSWFALLRLTPAGQVDPTFGDGRPVLLNLNVGTTLRDGILEDAVVLADGKIVVMGKVYTAGTTSRPAVARYGRNGTLDTTFGSGGLVVAQAPPTPAPQGGEFGGGGRGESIAVDSTGRLVVVGAMMGAGDADVALVRFTAGGALDTTFDGDGWARADLSGKTDSAQAVAIQKDGRIVVAGTSDEYEGGDIFVARFVDVDPAGQLEKATLTAATGVASVSGWAADADAATPVSVRVQVDGVVRATVAAASPRPDIAPTGALGFTTSVDLGGGNHSVCAVAVNQGAGVDTLLGCKSILVSSDPFGRVDTVSRRPGGVLISGWAIDFDRVAGPVTVLVLVDGTYRQTMIADQLRTDVGLALPGTGDRHGYQGVVTVPGGTHNVCVLALNQGSGTHRFVGCKNVTVTFDPIGSFDFAMRMGPGAMVWGWAIDPDVAGPVTVYLYADGVFIGATVAGTPRDGLDGVLQGYGPNHGFNDVISSGVPAGTRTFCAFAINQGAGSHVLLGCRYL